MYTTYQRIEDDYWCSGMCRAGLFYFSKEIEYGPPIRTCLSKMKHEIDGVVKPYARTAMLSGLWCLLLFFMHFGLYSRPTDEELQGNEDGPRPVNYDSKSMEMQQVPQASVLSNK